MFSPGLLFLLKKKKIEQGKIYRYFRKCEENFRASGNENEITKRSMG